MFGGRMHCGMASGFQCWLWSGSRQLHAALLKYRRLANATRTSSGIEYRCFVNSKAHEGTAGVVVAAVLFPILRVELWVDWRNVDKSRKTTYVCLRGNILGLAGVHTSCTYHLKSYRANLCSMNLVFYHTVSFEGCDMCRSPTFISNVPRCMRPTQILAQNSRRSTETSKPLHVTSSDMQGVLTSWRTLDYELHIS